jgi:two-component system phosphate regulon sensor histidine kinase PhoR
MSEKDSETNFEHRLAPQLFPQCRWMRWTAVWSASDSSFFCVSRDVTGEKEIEQMRRDLSNMIAHDLRTPLQSASFFFEALTDQGVDTKLTAPTLAKARHLQSSIEKMSQLLNEMMEIEKIDAQGIELNLKELDLDGIIFDALSAVEQVALSRDIKVVVETDGEPKVIADELRINQVLQNLLNNAIKFSPEGSVITVKAGYADALTEIRVIDSGPGIPAEQRELVFERFHQVGAPGQGFGFGLAICKLLVDAHGGTIAVEPPLETGCTICVRLPSSNLKRMQEQIE